MQHHMQLWVCHMAKFALMMIITFSFLDGNYYLPAFGDGFSKLILSLELLMSSEKKYCLVFFVCSFLRLILIWVCDLVWGQEELVKMYGPESIADLMSMKPASGGSQKTVKEESYNWSESTFFDNRFSFEFLPFLSRLRLYMHV